MIEIEFDIQEYRQGAYTYISEFMERYNLKVMEMDDDEEIRVAFIGITEPITLGFNKDQTKEINTMNLYIMLKDIPQLPFTNRVSVEEI